MNLSSGDLLFSDPGAKNRDDFSVNRPGLFFTFIILRLDLRSDMLILPPPGSWAIVAPVFLDGCDFAVHDPDEGGSVAGHTSILAAHMGSRNNMGIRSDDPFHLATPLPRIFAVCPNKFLHGEMLVGVVPVYEGRRMEICTNGVCILS